MSQKHEQKLKELEVELAELNQTVEEERSKNMKIGQQLQ